MITKKRKREELQLLRDEALDAYLNREDFQYDVNADALYQHYKDQYTQLGKVKTDIYNTEKAIKYFDLSSNVDYEEKSRYAGEGDRTQHLVNNQESAGKWDTAWTVQKYLPIIPGMETLARVKELWGYENLHLMEESERKNFNYLYCQKCWTVV